MKVSIVGQDTLAAAVHHCCSAHFEIVPLYDAETEILWVCYDTPIDEVTGEPDPEWVIDRIGVDLWTVRGKPLVLVSSQMPIGTIATLEKRHMFFDFAYSPENVRVASAIEDFNDQARVVVGIRSTKYNVRLQKLFEPFTKNLIFTTPETAEMVKHALNAYLGMSIAFINEIARLCTPLNADVGAISRALLSERRISPKAPLKAGAPFGGGHLMRDILIMEKLAAEHGIAAPIITHIRESNGGK